MVRRGGLHVGVMGQFVMLALAWGASFLFIKVGLEGLSPPQVVLGRLLAGAAALAAVSLVGRRPLPRERPTRTTLSGLLVGLAGVVVVLGPWNGLAGGGGLGQAACLLATLCYGAAFVYLRRFISPRGLGAIPVATVQVGLGAAIMLLLAPFTATAPVHLSWRVGLSVAALGVVGTRLAYVWNTNVVGEWGATNASTVTYVAPVVGVGLGIAVLGETLTWNEPLGAVIVIAGIAVNQGRLKAPGRRARPANHVASPPGQAILLPEIHGSTAAKEYRP